VIEKDAVIHIHQVLVPDAYIIEQMKLDPGFEHCNIIVLRCPNQERTLDVIEPIEVP
jgi:hypothetical protein